MTNAHTTVLLEEAVQSLAIHAERANGIYLDATFGRGGHSRAILQSLAAGGRLIATDRDPAAHLAIAPGTANAIDDARFCLIRARFGECDAALDEAGVEQIDGALFDVGVSSPQLDVAERGFSFRLNGPLDMRMDPDFGESAADWLNRAAQDDIREVIDRYGEERFAKQIAGAIVAARLREPIRTTKQLASVVAATVRSREPGQHPATRTFQALRIFTNQELEELEIGLVRAFARLKPGGRLVVICFHSLEDRIVKRYMLLKSKGVEIPRGLPLRADQMPIPEAKVIGKPIRASEAEVAANPRSRSAIMRVLEKAWT